MLYLFIRKGFLFMKKIKSFLALLLMGGMVLSGCGKDTPKPSGEGGSQQSGDGGSQGGEGQGGGQQGGEGQGGGQQGGGQQGGEGEGGEGQEIPENSRYRNKKLIVDSLSTQPQVAEMEAKFANAYASFFEDGTCEFVAPHDATYEVLFGTYNVNQADNNAVVSVKKSYSGEYGQYSWSIDQELKTLNVEYITSSDRFTLTLMFSYPATTVSLTLRALPNPPMSIVGDGVPEDPNGNSFNLHYQVEHQYWNTFFKNDYLYQRNFTVNATVPNAWMAGVTESYVLEVQGKKIHLNYPETPGAEQYFFLDDFVYENEEIIGLSVDVYNTNGSEWFMNTAQRTRDSIFDLFGFLPIDFMDMTYSTTTHSYSVNRTEYYDEETSSVTEVNKFTVSFEGDGLHSPNIQRIEYKDEIQQSHEFNFSKHGSTTVELPDVGGGGGGGGITPQPAEWPSALVDSYLAKIGATTDPVPAAINTNITSYELYPEDLDDVDTYFSIWCNKGGNMGDSYEDALETAGYTYNSSEGYWATLNNEIAITYDVYGQDFAIEVTKLSGGGGGGGVDPQPLAWPSDTVNAYLSIFGVTIDTLPEARSLDITAYEFDPNDILDVVDYFTITCVGGAALEASYLEALEDSLFEFDNGNCFYISPNEEFVVIAYAYSGDLVIDVGPFSGSSGPLASYVSAAEDFATATGITLPLVDDLAASYYKNDNPVYYSFITADGAPTTIFDTFVSALDTQLTSPTWSKGDLSEGSDFARYIYTKDNNDTVSVEYYKTDSYLAVSYNEAPPVVHAPTESYIQAANDFETATGIALPSFNDVEAAFYSANDPVLIEFITDDGTPDSIFDVFANALDLQLTEPDWFRDSLIDDEDNLIYVYRSDIFVLSLTYAKATEYLRVSYFEDTTPSMPTNPAVMYMYNGEQGFTDLQYDSLKNEYYLEDVYFEEGVELAIFMGGSKYLFFEDFVVCDPDTSNGAVKEGSLAIPPKHTFGLTESGNYSIYVNSSDEVYIVFGTQAPNNAFIKYGEGPYWGYFDLIEDPGDSSQLYAEGYYLEAGAEFEIFVSSGDWRYFEDIHAEWSMSEDKFEEGTEISSGHHAIKVLEGGYYNFYVKYDSSTEGGSVILNAVVEPADVTYKLLVSNYINEADAIVMAWVWGTEDPGHWMTLYPEEVEPGSFFIELTISNTYTGLILYRFIPGSSNMPYDDCTDFFVNGEENKYVQDVDYWNATSDINLTGVDDTIDAYF